ncbi:uncharacterized protein ACNLHF_023229 [Anomaloglossus baeobatrachus]|uniref:uncharacterized protein LOC142244636 n=1 Tax=Anomaloglossus baeobatrachus TaxID=238106 RepID=UPI003F4F422F
MRGLLILGCVALGLLLVAASHQDLEESETEARNEGVQGDLVKDRDIRSTGGKKSKPPKTGVWSTLSRPSKTKVKRSAEGFFTQDGKVKKCRGCFTSLILKGEADVRRLPPQNARRQRDTEEHVKVKKQKHLKSKNKEKRRRNKDHKHKHGHLTADPEIGENKRRKHHKGKKDRDRARTGGFTVLGLAPGIEKTHTDIRNTQDMTE